LDPALPEPGDARAASAIAARYNSAFADLPIRTPLTLGDRSHVFHQYTIAVDGSRDEIVGDLAEAGVGSATHYRIPVHRQPYVVERGITASLPMTDRASRDTLSLPMFPGLTDGDQATVIAAVRAAVQGRTPGRAMLAEGPAFDGAAAR